eukprot:m.282152 g.282152  ORF g.282152 m.282152 type:complete len:134 (+) comp40651_c0_seq67:2124-2525(+)
MNISTLSINDLTLYNDTVGNASSYQLNGGQVLESLYFQAAFTIKLTSRDATNIGKNAYLGTTPENTFLSIPEKCSVRHGRQRRIFHITISRFYSAECGRSGKNRVKKLLRWLPTVCDKSKRNSGENRQLYSSK